MKKLLTIALMLILTFALAACSSDPFNCDFCGQEKTGKKHTSNVYGTKMTVCDDCYKSIRELSGF